MKSMEVSVKRGKDRGLKIQENRLDRAIRYVAPSWGHKRFISRIHSALTTGYVGASKTRNSLKNWLTNSGDANADTVPDLPELWKRSSDLIRNNPLAKGIINTNVTNIIGPGLILKSQIDDTILGMSPEDADRWEEETEREFALYAESVECDAARRLNFYQKQSLALHSRLEKGDYFELMVNIPRAGSPYDMKLQSVEAERVSNPDLMRDTEFVTAGIEVDKHGATTKIHIRTTHPGNNLVFTSGKWDTVRAFGSRTGRRNFVHLAKMLRPGQRRGVPYLAPVMEALKQLGQYQEAELVAAVVSGMLTVFIETEGAGNHLKSGDGIVDTGEPVSAEGDMTLKNGAIMDLDAGEKANVVNPGRPNVAFDPFVVSVLKFIGSALEVPHEVILGHFSASFSASRAELNEAWKYFRCERQLMGDNYCRPIYENWMWEAVASGRITAPGFLSDPVIRKAYLGSDWVGPTRGQIKEGEEVRAMQGRLSSFVTTIDQETRELTGRSFKGNIRQIVKERKILRDAGFILTQDNELQAERNANLDVIESGAGNE